ncbi:unnamed protein product, partial [Pylaiella littoralis]
MLLPWVQSFESNGQNLRVVWCEGGERAGGGSRSKQQQQTCLLFLSSVSFVSSWLGLWDSINSDRE